MGQAYARSIIAGLAFLAWGRLGAAVLKVPGDHPTIALAVSRASDGDTVIVDDGVYLESNIEITKGIRIRSRSPFGAVIYGTSREPEAIFIVRAPARIEGFVLKNAMAAILQRDSPDVEWEASRLAVIGCQSAIVINDPADNIGSARIRNVVVLGGPRSVGISTNDAGRLDVSDCLIVNCETAFLGYDHLSFRVSGGAVLDCARTVEETAAFRPVPPATSRIEIGAGLRVLRSDALDGPEELREFLAYLSRAVFEVEGPSEHGAPEPSAITALRDMIEAGIESRNRRSASAKASFGRALAAARRIGSAEFSWRALLGMAQAEETEGKIEEAIAHYQEAVGLLETWFPDVPLGLHRIDFLADKAEAFEAIIGLLLDRNSDDPLGRRVEQAFDFSERFRTLTWRPALKINGRAPGLVSASLEISALQRKLQDPGLSGEAKETLLKSLERAEQDYHGALVGEERAAMKSGGLPKGALGQDGGLDSYPRGLGSMRNRLNGRAVLSYTLGEKGSFAFLMTGSGLEFASLPAASRVNGLVEPYLRFLQLAGKKDFIGAKAGRLLFDLLVGPFAAQLRSGPRRIIVVPDDRLHYLPFEALVESDGEEGGRAVFWAESVEISYAESVAAALGERPWRASNGRSAERGPAILAVGCSDGIRCDNRSRQIKRFFQPLPYVRREVGALARIFRDGRVTTLIDEEASEGRLKAMDLSMFGVIHLAAHGVIDDTDWWRSALLLRPDAENGEDGFLTALEISRLEIGRALVVLSGCGTGAGRLYEGEGIRGLNGAFRRAGAGHIVVSLWSVDDRTTSTLMEQFYRGLAAGLSAAEALADAKMKMIKAGYRNPFYWAPFVLIGNGAEPSEEAGMARRAADSIR